MIGTEVIARRIAEGTVPDPRIGGAQDQRIDGGPRTAAPVPGTGGMTGIRIETRIVVMIADTMTDTSTGRPRVLLKSRQVAPDIASNLLQMCITLLVKNTAPKSEEDGFERDLRTVFVAQVPVEMQIFPFYRFFPFGRACNAFVDLWSRLLGKLMNEIFSCFSPMSARFFVHAM